MDGSAIRPKVKNLALLLLHDGKGKILMQHRTKDAPRFPDCWGLFGGSIEEGETPKEALMREILEELAYMPNDPQLVLVTDFKDAEYEGKRYIFSARYDGEKLELHEGQGMAWFPLEEARRLKVSPHNKAVLDRIQPDLLSSSR